MKKFIIAPLLACAAVPSSASATVIYSFATVEPFSGGALTFSYEAADYLTNTGFIDRSLLTNATASIQRVQFLTSCPQGGGASACDQVMVVAGSGFGTTLVYRLFADGAFLKPGSYTSSSSLPTSLGVTAMASAVPEPATWGLLLAGFFFIGQSMRRRRSGGRIAVGAIAC